MNKTFHLMSGLPRSGSTVLSAIMNQHPYVYVTPTSPLLDLLVKNQDAWNDDPAVKANRFPIQLDNITRYMIQGAWAHRPEPVIVDKHRGWGANLPAARYLFDNEEIKMIVTTRDLPSIMASWLTILKNNPGNRIDEHVEKSYGKLTDEHRVSDMFINMVLPCLKILQTIREQAYKSNVLYVRYNTLVLSPEATLEKIEDFLDLPHHKYDFDNIVSDTVDDDLAGFGLDGLHKIRPKLHVTSSMPMLVLGKEMFEEFDEIGKEYGI